ncbi:MAG: adenosylcobinamide-GDP ribazoletransferase [Thermodesulfobacteriota bacterium]
MTDIPVPEEGLTPLQMGLRFPLQSMLAALRFLTILPISWRSEGDERFFQASLLWFPLVGLVIGAGAALSVFLLQAVFPQAVVAIFAMALLAGLSGCLHLDGLADSGDGLLSSRSRERSLAIMRDSRSGAMGVIVLIFVLLGKYGALSSLPQASLIPAVLLVPMGGRIAILISMAVLPYARSGGGLGELFYAKDRYLVAGLGLCFGAGVSAFLVSFQLALFMSLTILASVSLFSFYCFRKLGGATGDTLGAVCELTELGILLCFLVTPPTI